MGKTFTLQGFEELFERHEEAHTDSVKTFFTNGKNVAGIGNGYLQDILFRARIHPRRKVGQITRSERRALYGAVKDTVSTAVSLGGRESERDLYGRPGNYRPLMDRHARGKPCSVCGLPIEKISYLGGSCYVCPACQT